MIFLFWISTILLTLMAVAFLVPWLVPLQKCSTCHQCKAFKVFKECREFKEFKPFKKDFKDCQECKNGQALNSKSTLIFTLILIPLFSYVFYYSFGSSQYLKDYYSLTDQKNREQMRRIRPLMTELKKQEFRLRFHLEENPKDTVVQSQLLELLAIQALQAGDINLAKQFLMKALEVLPEHSNYLSRRNHLQDLLRSNFR